jgi:hypothetical protein
VNRLNNQQVGGKRRTHAFDSLWCLKYLKGFKWSHLVEQLSFEKRIEEQRMRIEITQAKKQAQHFIEQVSKGEKIKQLEEKVTAYFNISTRVIIRLFFRSRIVVALGLVNKSDKQSKRSRSPKKNGPRHSMTKSMKVYCK